MVLVDDSRPPTCGRCAAAPFAQGGSQRMAGNDQLVAVADQRRDIHLVRGEHRAALHDAFAIEPDFGQRSNGAQAQKDLFIGAGRFGVETATKQMMDVIEADAIAHAPGLVVPEGGRDRAGNFSWNEPQAILFY